jgi:hypothetical protein
VVHVVSLADFPRIGLRDILPVSVSATPPLSLLDSGVPSSTGGGIGPSAQAAGVLLLLPLRRRLDNVFT